MTDPALAEPTLEHTLAYACGCIDRWLTYQPLPDGTVLHVAANCRTVECMTCCGERRCPQRLPELNIAEAAQSLEDVAIANGTVGRGRKRHA
jgi:hypothetical protein